MPEAITIPLGPDAMAVLLAVLALVALAIWSGVLPALLGVRTGRWDRLGATLRGVLGALGALWFVVLLLAVAAGIAGALALIADPSGGGLGLGALLVALIGAPFLIWSTMIRQTALDYQREGHITDRISKAVEQLGAEKTVKLAGPDGQTVERSEPNIEVRIGGILALERIAQDSTRLDNGRDHVRVMEILCAYVRENAPASTARDFPLPDWEPLKDDATEAERQAHEAWRRARFGGDLVEGFDHIIQPNAHEWARSLPPPRADVALALTVIGRRSTEQTGAEAAWPDAPTRRTKWVFDLPFARLPDEPVAAPLPKADLAAFKTGLEAWTAVIRAYKGYRLDLRGANLQGADMSGGCFSGARLNGARMERADLRGARMEGAVLSRARMEGADLRVARMEGADLLVARMEGAVLAGARMEGANLGGARMEGAQLSWTRMEGADLGGARMEGAQLSWARMEGADLRRARMEGANLDAARMDASTSFGAAALPGAALRDVAVPDFVLSPEQTATMFGDGSVTLPGVEPGGEGWPAHWPVRALEWREFEGEWRKWQADPGAYVPPA